MPGQSGLRLALEAAFLILLAVAAGLADLRPLLIVLIVVAGWVLVALIEYAASRQRELYPPFELRYGSVARGDTMIAPPKPQGPEIVELVPAQPQPESEEQTGVIDPPDERAGPRLEPLPPRPVRRRFWRRSRDAAVEEPPEPPKHVRVVPPDEQGSAPSEVDGEQEAGSR